MAYATKDESRVLGPWQLGKLSDSAQGCRTDFHAVAEQVRDGGALSAVAQEAPGVFVRYHRGLAALSAAVQQQQWRDVTCVYIAGPTGSGKSSFVYDTFGHANVYALASHQPLWFDGYEAQRVLLIDEFEEGFDNKALLRLLDGHPFRAPIKGGFQQARWTFVFVVGNYWLIDGFTPELQRRFAARWWFGRSRGEYAECAQWLTAGADRGQAPVLEQRGR